MQIGSVKFFNAAKGRLIYREAMPGGGPRRNFRR